MLKKTPPHVYIQLPERYKIVHMLKFKSSKLLFAYAKIKNKGLGHPRPQADHMSSTLNGSSRKITGVKCREYVHKLGMHKIYT